MKPAHLVCIFLTLVIGNITSATVRPPSINSVEPSADLPSSQPNSEPSEKTDAIANTNESSITSNDPSVPSESTKDAPDLKTSASGRRNKMLDFFGGFFPHPMMYQNQFFQPHQFYDDSGAIPDDEDLMSRANRRKPAVGQNSPIFYIRLPPTPYMYVPGMGYISQPPTIRPMAIAPPPPPPPVVNPFINVPVNFLSNGKPTNVYEWPGATQMNFAQPQYPSYLPTRPIHQQRPASYRPHKPSYLPDSKITHLKGPYVFNGRPEDIYVLPQSGRPQSQFAINPYSQGFASAPDYSLQHHQQHDYSNPHHQQPDFSSPPHQHLDYSSPHHPSHHQQAYNNAPAPHFSGYNPAFNPGFNSIYSEPMTNFY